MVCLWQEHERKQGQKQGSMMQTVWAAVTGAGSQKELVPSADYANAKSADAGTAKPQVAVITVSGQELAPVIGFAAFGAFSADNRRFETTE